MWVGFDDMQIEGDYVWADGVRFNSTTPDVWFPGEPGTNTGALNNRDCGTAFLSNGRLADAECDGMLTYPYMCQITQGTILLSCGLICLC